MTTTNSRLSLGNLAAAAVLVAVGFAAGRLSLQGATADEAEPAHENRRRAVAQFEVSSRRLLLLDPVAEFDDRSWRVFQKTQAAYLKSPFVLQTALGLNEGAVSRLPMLQGIEDQIDWLRDHLVIGYPEDGEILEIALVHPSAPEEDMRRVVEAIGKAYVDEIVFRDQSRQRLPIQILKKSFGKLAGALRDKREEYAALRKEQGDAGEDTPELIQREREIASLQGAHDRVAERIQSLQIEIQAPKRIRSIGANLDGAPIAQILEAGEKPW